MSSWRGVGGTLGLVRGSGALCPVEKPGRVAVFRGRAECLGRMSKCDPCAQQLVKLHLANIHFDQDLTGQINILRWTAFFRPCPRRCHPSGFTTEGKVRHADAQPGRFQLVAERKHHPLRARLADWRARGARDRAQRLCAKLSAACPASAAVRPGGSTRARIARTSTVASRPLDARCRKDSRSCAPSRRPKST